MNTLRLLAAIVVASLSGCSFDEFVKTADTVASGYYGNRYRAEQPAYHPPPAPVYYPNY